MAAYTASQTGNWNQASTWNNAGVPGDGDTATIGSGFTVTLSDGRTVGTAALTSAITIDGTGVLSVTGTLTLHGHLNHTNGGTSNFQAGSTLIADPPGGQTYAIALSSGNATCNFLGSSGSRCTVSTTARGGGHLYFVLGNNGHQGVPTCQYTDFTNIGDATNAGPLFLVLASGATISYLNNTFTGGGKVTINPNGYTDYTLTYSNNVHVGSLAVCCSIPNSATLTSGTRTISNNRFDVEADINVNGCSVTHNHFDGGYQLTGYAPLLWQYNLVNAKGWVGGLIGPNNATNTVCFDDTSNNPHTFIANQALNYTLSGLVFDSPQGSVGDFILSGSNGANGSNTLSAKNCIILPNSAGTSPGELISPVNSGYVFTAEHNTVCSTAAQGANAEAGVGVYGETFAGVAGMYASLRSNLVYAPTGKGSFLLRHVTGTVSDPLATPAMGDYNACNAPVTASGSGVQAVYGAHGGYIDTVSTVTNPMFTSTTGLGAHDLVANPNFVDFTRNVATFDTAYLGNSAASWATGQAYAVGDIRSASSSGFYANATVNFRCIAAHTSSAGDATNGQPGVAANWRTNWELASLYRVRSSALAYSAGTPRATPRDLYEWVKAGAAPTNALLNNAGHDGATIGAVAYVAAAGLTAGAATYSVLGITVAAADATGGTLPYSYQWQRSTAGYGAGFANLANGGGVAGATTRTLTDGSAVAGTVYYYRLKYVDSAGSPATVYSNEIPAMLYGGGGMGGFTNTFGGGFLS